jgi:hypothetical protein
MILEYVYPETLEEYARRGDGGQLKIFADPDQGIFKCYECELRE